MQFLVLLACVALASAGYYKDDYGDYGGYGDYGLGYGYGGYYPSYGYGHGYPKYGYGYGHGYGHDYGHGYGHISKGYAGASAKYGESSKSSSNRRRSKRTGEWEQTITTRVKKIVECEWECRRSWTCRRQWSVAHSYWGKCSQCKSC